MRRRRFSRLPPAARLNPGAVSGAFADRLSALPLLLFGLLVLAGALTSVQAQTPGPVEDLFPDPQLFIAELQATPYLEATADPEERSVRDHLVALGAIQKIRGTWAPRRSERINGLSQTYTWRVRDGFMSAEVVDELDLRLREAPGIEPLFACEARACGSSVQWANRIFGERLLYGTEVSQRYRAFRLRTPADDANGTPIGSEGGIAEARLLIYASARSSDRQYLRVELLWLR